MAKEIYVSKKLVIITTVVIVLIFIAVILGLTLGLKNAYKTECLEDSEAQKYEICRDLSCRNNTVLQSKLKN